MKFLIVNGYQSTRNHLKMIEEFKQLIYSITQQLKEVADIEFDFILADRHSVQEYLFEPETSLVRPEHGLKFDAIDMIFIAASPNIRPWNQSMRNILTLIRMCMKTKKLLFMTSFGAQALAYLCATNISNYINITNGNGEGCKLVDFPKFTNQALKNGLDDFFLDSTTGDLYYYSRQTDEWIPKFNVGLHHRRDAMEYQSIGKFVVKSPTYKPKQQMLSNQTEMTCIIKKQFLNYWLFKDVSMEFQIKQYNQWDIHSITFVQLDKKFVVLAENNFRGPLILQSDNILALLFEIECKSKDQTNIVQNFIENGIKTIRYSTNYNSISITFEKYFNSTKGINNIEIIYNKNQKKSFQGNDEISKTQHKAIEYRKHINAAIQELDKEKPNLIHVGFQAKKNKVPQIVQHNNIAQKNYKVKRRKSFSLKQKQLMILSQQVQNHEFLQQNPNLDNFLDDNFSSKRHLKIKTEPKTNQLIKSDEEHELEIKTPKNIFNQVLVRKILHPSLEDQYLGTKKIWVPGFLKYKYSESSIPITRHGSRPMTDRF